MPTTLTARQLHTSQGTIDHPVIAIDDDGNPCPTYTALLVNPPDTSQVYTVPTGIEACRLQVHPITPTG